MATAWIRNCAVGEAVGIAAVAVAYAAADRGLAPLVPAVLIAGACEGACLGTAQALVLRRAGVPVAGWIGATVLAAVLGYGLSLLGGAGQGAEAEPEPGLFLMLGLASAAGVAMGAIMGAVQWLAARRHLSLAAWVWRNAVGWALAMMVIFAGAGLATVQMALWQVALLGAASGAVAGALLGAVTRAATPG